MGKSRVVEEVDLEPPSRCAKCVYYTWKFITCMCSHFMLVSLVVSYCVLGAHTFMSLECENEKEVKKSVAFIRGNMTEKIWKLTSNTDVLHQDNWTDNVMKQLALFEQDILFTMRQKGWDGNEDPESIQWTFAGALFFSIIVITTIGYGHIAPKTQMGKVVTIFYAILGIPLMLLCLSNIGDVMATSFRFLYWRVCCYVCTKKPKRKKHRSSRASTRQPSVRYTNPRARSASARRHGAARPSKASSELPPYSHSDTECRYLEDTSQLPRNRLLRVSQISRFSDGAVPSPGVSRAGKGGPAAMTRDRGSIRGTTTSTPLPKSTTLRPNTNTMPRQSPRPLSATERRQKRSQSEARNFNHDTILDPMEPIFFNKYAMHNDNMDDEIFTPPKSYKGTNNRTRSVYDMEDEMDSGDEIIVNFRSKSLPRHPQRDFFLQDEPIHGNSTSKYEYTREDMKQRYRDEYLYSERSRPQQNKRQLRSKSQDPRETAERYRRELDEEDWKIRRERQRFTSEGPDERLRRGRGFSRRYSDEEDEDDDDDDSNYYEDCRKYRDVEAPPNPPKTRPRKAALHAPAIMSPMGISAYRQSKYMENFDIEYAYDDGQYHSSKTQIKPVPIWLCVFLVISYIIAGAFLFSKWENWSFLDSAYFCFITLTTIGFGDFVPAQGVKSDSEISIALCSLYLLFGISLLAMSFNLVQEEVIANVKAVAKRLGIIKPDVDESDEDT